MINTTFICCQLMGTSSPRQPVEKQAIVPVLIPAHSAPPFVGTGLEHDLDLDCIPESQVGLQAVQCPHIAHPPSTGALGSEKRNMTELNIHET